MNSVGTVTAEFHSRVTFECKAAMTTPVELQDGQRKDLNSGNIQHTLGDILSSDDGLDHDRGHTQMEGSPSSSLGGTSLASSPALPTESANVTSTELNQDYENPADGEEMSSLEDSDPATNDAHSFHGDHEEISSPLSQLKCALDKGGMMGMRLNIPTYNSTCEDTMTMTMNDKINGFGFPPGLNSPDMMGEVYRCHLCNFSVASKFHFNSHMNTHFDHKCPFCDYTSRTEGRLKRHVKDFHSDSPPDRWTGNRVSCIEGTTNGTDEGSGEIVLEETGSNGGNDTTPPGKNRQYRCKQCSFVAVSKNAFWEHSKTHIKAEKLLTCPKCPFVTEYKHHLEYHLRNHFGSKPFKCAKCNYSCVNKSMLNSHMKSHSNVYQYRCADCSYATKYCHSLKLHLRKYVHKPASVLNTDGSPNPYPIIDVYGTRRGPRPKKGKHCVNALPSENGNVIVSQHPPPPPGYPNNMPLPPLIPSTMGMPFLYPPHLLNGYHGSMFVRPPLPPLPAIEYREMESRSGETMGPTSDNCNGNTGQTQSGLFKCRLCDFCTEARELFSKHMLLHAAAENQDLCKLYGINSDTLLHDHPVSTNNSLSPNQRNLSDCGNRNIYSFDSEHGQKNNSSEKRVNSNSQNGGTDSLLPPMIHHPQAEISKTSPTSDILLGGMAIPSSTNPTTDPPSVTKIAGSLLHQKSYGAVVKSELGQGVIVSHRSSPHQQLSNTHSCANPGSPILSNNIQVNETPEERPETSSPLDLSSYKNISTNAINSLPELPKACKVTELQKSETTTIINAAPPSTPTHSRSRRKGRAYKLDRLCLKLQEHDSHEDFESMDSNPLCENAFENLEEQAEILENELQQKIPKDVSELPIVTFPEDQQQRGSPLLQNKCHIQSSTTPSVSETTQVKPPEAPASKPNFFSMVSPLHFQLPQFPGINEMTGTHKPATVMCHNHGRAPYHHSTSTFPLRMSSVSSGEAHFHLQPPSSVQDTPQTTTKSPVQEQKLAVTLSEKVTEKWVDTYTCNYCDMAFKDCVMYTMHMGYHGYRDPFTCNMCGEQSKDKVSFFLHIARAAHL